MKPEFPKNIITRDSPTNSKYTHPLKTSSIGIFDTSSMMDDDIPDHLKGGDRSRLREEFNVDSISRINKMKNLLLDGSSQEDIALLR